MGRTPWLRLDLDLDLQQDDGLSCFAEGPHEAGNNLAYGSSFDYCSEVPLHYQQSYRLPTPCLFRHFDQTPSLCYLH